MKNNFLLSTITLLSLSGMIWAENNMLTTLENDYQDYSNIYKPITPTLPTKKSKNKNIKTITFIPHELFGGHNATGQYNRKNKTAMITHGQNIYNFSKITEERTNPWLDKKNLDPDLIMIGSFSNKTNHAGMPVTIYIFGIAAKNNPKNSQESMEDIHTAQNKIDAKKQPSQKPIGSNPGTYAPVAFQPAEQFAGQGLVGNYFSSNQVATIHDPSGVNPTSYTFKNVQTGGIAVPTGLTLIGSYTSQPACKGMICSHAIMMMNVYGQLTETTPEQ